MGSLLLRWLGYIWKNKTKKASRSGTCRRCLHFRKFYNQSTRCVFAASAGNLPAIWSSRWGMEYEGNQLRRELPEATGFQGAPVAMAELYCSPHLPWFSLKRAERGKKRILMKVFQNLGTENYPSKRYWGRRGQKSKWRACFWVAQAAVIFRAGRRGKQLESFVREQGRETTAGSWTSF